MSAYKYSYRIEMRTGQDMRQVDADSHGQTDDWLIFYRNSPQGGGAKEYWRVRMDVVASMETRAS